MKKNAGLKSIVSDLRKHSLVCDNSLSVLEQSAGGVSDLLKRQIAKKTNNPLPVSYSSELRSFALTLHFYSPHAYRYVRKMFDTCLPHPRTIERWYQSIDGSPGFTAEAFTALRARAAVSADKGRKLACALIMDEMAIRQQVEWDGNKYHGYIDVGSELDDDCLPMAKEAFVFMVVGINDSFKLPVGYFLIDGLGSIERANLVNQCLTRLHGSGVDVASLTFDGAASNLAMIKNLGCNLDFSSPFFKTSFPHPVSKESVFVFLDPCHMMKLVRNTLGDKKSMVDGNIKFVKWEYFEKLHALQEQEGLHLGNKLRTAHMAYYRKKMNVRLAAQTLSSSVATSLQFCLEENIPQFAGCEPTIKFIQIFDALFDVLTSRNLKAFGYKKPLQESNKLQIHAILSEARSYICSLKESPNGKPILESNRKTGFLGFIICIDSLLSLYDKLVSSSQFGMKFLCSFKVSQDHIELFFGKIRSLGGCNNNPSARHFRSAYKKLLVHNDIQDSLHGNCIPLETIPILSIPSSSNRYLHSSVPSADAINNSTSRNRILDPDENLIFDHDYTYIPNPAHLSLCSNKIVAYIAGFVVFKLKKNN